MGYSVVTVSAVVGTMASSSFTFDGPAVSYVVGMAGNAVTSSGAAVTISGLNFGAYSFTPSAAAVLASKACSTTSWTSGTAVACMLGTLSSLSVGYSVLTVSAVVGTRASSSFTFDGPAVSYASPSNMATTYSGTITIAGLNFAWGNYTLTATVAGSSCITSSWTSSTTVSCSLLHYDYNVLHTGGRSAKRVGLTMGGVVSTKLSAFTFNSPVLSAPSLNLPETKALSITITGIHICMHRHMCTKICLNL